jgi:hypothetical protein
MKWFTCGLVVGALLLVGASVHRAASAPESSPPRPVYEHRLLTVEEVVTASGVKIPEKVPLQYPGRNIPIEEVFKREIVISKNLLPGLNKLSEQGWELVSVAAGGDGKHVYYLKRRK